VLGFVNADELGWAGLSSLKRKDSREAGKVYLEVDRDRRAFESYEVQPHPGQTVVLTIDQLIHIVLSKRCRRRRAESCEVWYGDRHGSAHGRNLSAGEFADLQSKRRWKVSPEEKPRRRAKYLRARFDF